MILFDESHNEFCTISGTPKRRQYTSWKERIEKYGVAPVSSQKEVDLKAKVMVFAEPHSYFTLEETLSLIHFVCEGGSLLLIGNHHNAARYYSYGCNEVLNVISAPFGIRFNPDEVFFSHGNTVENFAEHPAVKGVKILHYWRGCSLTVLRQADKAQGIAFGSRHDTSDYYPKSPVVAAVYKDKGKIFCLGDSSVWADPPSEDDDNLLFAENVIKWALR